MEFTSTELKQIERLRMQERRWPRTRWFLLATGITIAGVYIYMLVLLLHLLFLSENDPARLGDVLSHSNVLVFAVFWPNCLLALCYAAWCISLAIRNWHGNTGRMLLLKLLQAQQAQSPGAAKIT
jgi:hypothetical protein